MRLKELAGQLGLSQTTVSRALNGYPEVSEATRQRVNEAARRLGYRPNANAIRLATGRVGAVVLSAPTPRDERIKLLTDLGMPFVVHGRSEATVPHAWLDIDNEGALRRATSHLLDLGHRRIAMINGPADQTFSIHRERGFREALLARGVTPDPRLIVEAPFTDEIGFRNAQSFLDQNPRPTAIIAGSMMTALGVFRAIRAAGLQLGKDVSMIAHDDVFPYLNADNMVPSMSTTRSSIRAAGFRIGELVLQVLAGKPPADIHELWPVELVLRESSGPPPEA